MRLPLFSTLALLACSALTTAAHADTFSFAFTPSGGATQTLTVDQAAVAGNSAYDQYWANTTVQGWKTGMAQEEVVLYNSSTYKNAGYGSLDLYWQDAGNYAYYSGEQLFSVANGVTKVLTGTYELTGNQALGYCGLAATLVITDLSKPVTVPSSTAVTPEPSSMILLGTGLMGAAGMVRRRFLTV